MREAAQSRRWMGVIGMNRHSLSLVEPHWIWRKGFGSYRTHFAGWSRPRRCLCWGWWGSCCPLPPAGGAGGSQKPALWTRSHTSWNTTTQRSEQDTGDNAINHWKVKISFRKKGDTESMQLQSGKRNMISWMSCSSSIFHSKTNEKQKLFDRENASFSSNMSHNLLFFVATQDDLCEWSLEEGTLTI